MIGRAAFLVGLVVGSAVTAAAFVLLRTDVRPAGPGETPFGRSVEVDDAPDLAGGVRPADTPTASSAPSALASRAAGDAAPTPAEAEFLRKALAEERRRSVAARIRPDDSGAEVLRRVLEERADPNEVLVDFETFASHVHPATGRVARFAAPFGDAPIALRDTDAKGASILEFGPGRFVIDTDAWGPAVREVRELEIRGAGKDRTVLVIERDLVMAANDVEHLRIHDVTIETGGGLALDVRAATSAIFEDVRFLPGSTAGHGAAIGVSGKGYVGLRRCELLGGGADRGYGVSLRGSSLVLAVECTFADLNGTVIGGFGTAGGSIVRLSRCRFLGAPVADRGSKRDGDPSEIKVEVIGGTALMGGKDLSDEVRRARWGERFATSVDGVAFGSDPDRPTLGVLLGVIDAVRSQVEGTPISVEMVSAERLGQPSSYSLSTWDGKSERAEVYTVRMRNGRGMATPYPQGGGIGVPKPGELEGLPPLADVMSSSGVDVGLDATAIQLYVYRDKQVLWTVFRDGHLVVRLDPRTGAVVR